MAMDDPKQLVHAKATPVRKNCCITWRQSPSVPTLVACRLSNTS